MIWSSSKQVTKEFRVTGIIVKIGSTIEDEKHIFAENFVMQSLEDVYHDERRLY